MKTSRLFDQIIAKSWWTILFVLISLFAYDIASKKKMEIQKSLEYKLATLEISLLKEKEHQILLKEQIAAQEDPGWIELTLMRKLGLVPKNQKKVVFQ